MFVLNDKVVEYSFGGSRARLLLSGNDTGGVYCAFEMFSPAGRATPMHSHESEDESLLVLDGEMTVEIDGETHLVRAGASTYLPRKSRHRLINTGSRTARYVVICTPAGFDRFVDACAPARHEPVTPHDPTDAEKAKMREAAPRFGITLYPPAKS